MHAHSQQQHRQRLSTSHRAPQIQSQRRFAHGLLQRCKRTEPSQPHGRRHAQRRTCTTVSLAMSTCSTSINWTEPPDVQDAGCVRSVAWSTECCVPPTGWLDACTQGGPAHAAGASGELDACSQGGTAYTAETSRPLSGPSLQQPTPHLPRGASVPGATMGATKPTETGTEGTHVCAPVSLAMSKSDAQDAGCVRSMA